MQYRFIFFMNRKRNEAKYPIFKMKHHTRKIGKAVLEARMIQAAKPFIFYQCISIPKATGKWAKNLKELKKMIVAVSPDSIYHHTYQYFLKGHILEYTNDFAQWAGESLEERALSEHLSIIDPYEFNNIEDLRKKLLDVIDDYMERFTSPKDAFPGNEFFFN